MTKNRTELVFILDRSGSMQPLTDDTIGGFNSVIERNREIPGEVHVTTILFDTEVSLLHNRSSITNVKPMTHHDYRPGGCTALHDAIGFGINLMIANQRSMLPEKRADRVQFVIITDGMENASKNFNGAQIRHMISKEIEKYDWDFLFLGANIDAIATAGQIGIRADRAVTAMGDRAGTALQYDAVAKATIAMRNHVGPMQELGSDWKCAVEHDVRERRRK